MCEWQLSIGQCNAPATKEIEGRKLCDLHYQTLMRNREMFHTQKERDECGCDFCR